MSSPIRVSAAASPPPWRQTPRRSGRRRPWACRARNCPRTRVPRRTRAAPQPCERDGPVAAELELGVVGAPQQPGQPESALAAKAARARRGQSDAREAQVRHEPLDVVARLILVDPIAGRGGEPDAAVDEVARRRIGRRATACRQHRRERGHTNSGASSRRRIVGDDVEVAPVPRERNGTERPDSPDGPRLEREALAPTEPGGDERRTDGGPRGAITR